MSDISISGCSCILNGISYNFYLHISLKPLMSILQYTYSMCVEEGIQLSIDQSHIVYYDGTDMLEAPPFEIYISNPDVTIENFSIDVAQVDFSQGNIFINWSGCNFGLTAGGVTEYFTFDDIHSGSPVQSKFEPDDTSYLEYTSTDNDYCLGPKTIE